MRPSEAAFDFGLKLGSLLADREDFVVVSLTLFVDFLAEGEIVLHLTVVGIFKVFRLVSDVGCEPAAGDGLRFRFLDFDFNITFGSFTSSVVALVACGVDCGVPVGGSGTSATTAVSSMTD